MRRPPRGLRVERLRPREADVLRQLYDAYVEELASFGAAYRRRRDGTWQYRPPGGRWGADHLTYWLEDRDEHVVLVFRLRSAVVGFAMIGLRPAVWMPAGTDACIAEFFVVRSARRHGVGEAAALRILRRWRGRWEITEVSGNAPAIAFWRRTIGRLTGGRFEEVVVRGGLVQRFTNSGGRR